VYSTQVFYYVQRQIVVLLTGTSPRSFMPYYAKPLKLHRGVDNQLQFQFLNQAQKPVNITDKVVTFRLISSDGNRQLLKKSLTLQFAATGIAAVFITAAELADIPPQKCFYSLEIPDGTFDYPVFVDPASGARGDVDIIDSVLPAFVDSENVTIPNQLFPNTHTSANICFYMSGQTANYYSSVIDTKGNPFLTIQTEINQYTGNITIQGSTLPDSGWYNIGANYVYANQSNTQGYNVSGYHPYVRLQFSSTFGDVTAILAR